MQVMENSAVIAAAHPGTLAIPEEWTALPDANTSVDTSRGGGAVITEEVPTFTEQEAIAVAGTPAIILPKRRARFRLPRKTKSELLSRFYGDVSHSPRTLAVVAHQDDEAIGAGARLACLPDAWVVHVTDGAPLDPLVAQLHGFETREEYAAARAAEARQALTLAGIPAERQICLGLIDGEASERMVELCMRVADLLDAVRPDIVVTHAYEGGHTDHDATAFAVHAAVGVLRREGLWPPAVLELATYNGYPGRKVLQQFVPNDAADRVRRELHLGCGEQRLKQQMLDCFRSQQSLLRHFNPCWEVFRPAPRYIFTRPPHHGRLNYERYGNPALGTLWRQRARAALFALKLRQR